VLNVRLLGTGCPPPNPKRKGPATLVTLGDEHFLVDAGSGVGNQMMQIGLRPFDWPRVFITHHHSDHVIDLAHLIVTRWIVGQNAPFEIWGPAGTKRQMDKLMDYMTWDLEVRRHHMPAGRALPELRVTEFDEGRLTEIGGVLVSAFLVEHDPVKPAFGFKFEGGGRSIAISGDTRPCENLIRWSYRTDVLVHECCEMSKTSWVPGCGWDTLEEKIRDLASYHTQPDQLGRIAREAKTKQLAVTHMMPASEPDELRELAARDYSGSILIGEDLTEI